MLISSALLSLVPAAPGQTHADLHPAEALVFVEVPSIQELWSETLRLPLLALAMSDETMAWVGELVGSDGPFDPEAELTRAVQEGELHMDGAGPALWHMIRSAKAVSFSASGLEALRDGTPWQEIARGQATIDELSSLAEVIEDYTVEFDHLPPSLDAITSIDSGLLTDAWGNPYVYEPSDGFDYDLSSLGADGAPGGVFAGQDLNLWSGESVMLTAFSGIDLRLAFDFDDAAVAGTAVGFLELAQGQPGVRVGVSPHDGLLLSFDEAPGFELHVLHEDERIVLDMRAAGSAVAAPAAAKAESSLAESEAYLTQLEELGPERGTTAVQGFMRLSPADLVKFTHELDGGEMDPAEQKVQEILLGFFDRGPGAAWRTQISDGRLYRSAIANVGSKAAEGAFIDRDFAATLPSDAVFAAVTAFDAKTMFSTMLEVAGAAAEGESPEEWLAQGEQITGVNLRRDLIDPLGSTATVFLESLSAIGLPPVRAYVQLDDADRFRTAMSRLAGFVNENASGVLQIKEQDYRGVTLFNFSFQELQDMGPFVPRPAIAVADDRLIVSLSSIHTKRDIKRLGSLTESGDRALHPLAAEAGKLEGDLSTMTYLDWSGVLKGGYGVARAALGMFGGMLGELPFDPTDLPDADDLLGDFPAAMSFTRVHDGRMYMTGETSVGPEIFVLPGLAALLVPRLMESAYPSEPSPAEAAVEPEVDDDEASAAATLDGLQLLRTGLTVYKLDRGGFPDTLEALVEGSAAFPDGYLQGARVPEDGWGFPFVYRPGESSYTLYSVGADGRDDGGGNDDLGAD